MTNNTKGYQMTETYVPQEFMDRLENWGRVYRLGYSEPSNITATYGCCEKMKELAGFVDDVVEQPAAKKIDEDDARIIEWCFCRADVRMRIGDRALLRAHYVSRANPRFVCRKLHIRPYQYNNAVHIAVVEFYKIVKMFA